MDRQVFCVILVSFVRFISAVPDIDVTFNPMEDTDVTKTILYRLSGGKWFEIMDNVSSSDVESKRVSKSNGTDKNSNGTVAFNTQVNGQGCRVHKLNMGLKCNGKLNESGGDKLSQVTCKLAKLDLGLDCDSGMGDCTCKPVKPTTKKLPTTAKPCKCATCTCASPRHPKTTSCPPIHLNENLHIEPVSNSNETSNSNVPETMVLGISFTTANLITDEPSSTENSEIGIPRADASSTKKINILGETEKIFSIFKMPDRKGEEKIEKKDSKTLLYRNVRCLNNLQKKSDSLLSKTTVCCSDGTSTDTYEVLSTPKRFPCENPNCPLTCNLIE